MWGGFAACGFGRAFSCGTLLRGANVAATVYNRAWHAAKNPATTSAFRCGSSRLYGTSRAISHEDHRVKRSPVSALRLLLAPALVLAMVVGISAQSSRRDKRVKTAESAAGDSQEVARGKMVYAEHCAICHYSDSTAQKIGPGLKGLDKRGKFANGRKVDDAALTRWIESGGKNMPGFRKSLKPEQIRDLIAYMKTI
jgi:mono/diheme cytochrome c family protein